MTAFILFLADAGRGDNPSDIGGIAIIAGIVLAVAILGFVLHLVIHKGFLRNRGANEPGDKHEPGRVGRL